MQDWSDLQKVIHNSPGSAFWSWASHLMSYPTDELTPLNTPSLSHTHTISLYTYISTSMYIHTHIISFTWMWTKMVNHCLRQHSKNKGTAWVKIWGRLHTGNLKDKNYVTIRGRSDTKGHYLWNELSSESCTAYCWWWNVKEKLTYTDTFKMTRANQLDYTMHACMG